MIRGSCDVALNIYILVLPLTQVAGLQMPRKKKLGVVAIFLTGLLLSFTPDPEALYIRPKIVENNIAIICSCMPTLAAFWRHTSEALLVGGRQKQSNSHIQFFNVLHNWHGDLKPTNIILVGGHFKISDLGESVIQSPLSTSTSRICLTVSTRTYAAPEAHSKEANLPQPVAQVSDVWSLGCVLSLCASFVVLGPPGIREYTRRRQDAVRGLTGYYEDVFHDGARVLPEAGRWHERLRASTVPGDIWTAGVLRVVENWMLVPEEVRLPACEVDAKMREVFALIPEES
ncbi:hypothetical protein B0I35DRAFT_459482 [Stachybotrys elegans]|uniref:Protein kinase domain-containing protein n=1 Tax=Stachybotrys elegans TaxID=80388 RepID=A0A8K0STN5_9HYPO|nr:hypothetical protein B0I35DRAFT_459482 [Stachybotrys elegans]